ncbi:MAG: type II toxin-antitoxin system Phd/YefM family antitoxin [Pseudonocardiaceae bacterium]
MSTLPLAEVKARLSAVLDEITRTHERVVVTRNGRPEAVILSIDDLAAIEDTLDILGTPGLPGRLDDAAAEIDAGDWVGAEELARRYLPDDRR